MAGPQQGPGGRIQGSVVDAASGRPLQAASIAVWSRADSTLVTGAVARPDGSFRIEGLRPGRYYLRVSSLGYTSARSEDVTISPAAPQVDVPPIRLAASAVQIEGLQVTAERNTAALAPDRNTYQARELPTAGGNATDVLRNVPAVDVDGDGKVSLRGNSNVAIQINGRAAPLTGDQLTRFLQSLPANTVDRVEVIPNPSAKYDPDGMAGIINIVLKQNTDLGTSGGILLGVGTGNRYNASGNLGWQKGRLTLFGNYAFNNEERDVTGFNWRENRFTTPLTFQQQDSDGHFDAQTHTFNGTADLRLNRQNVLSTALLFSHRGLDAGQTDFFQVLDAGRTVTRRYDNLNGTDDSGNTVDYSLSYRRTLQPQRNELSSEVRFIRSSGQTGNTFDLDLLNLDGTPSGIFVAPTRNDIESTTNNLNAQLDYTRAFGDAKLETGYKGTARRLDNSVDYTPQTATLVSNALRYSEYVNAAYGVLTYNAGRASVQGGLRLEQANNTFHLNNNGSDYDNNYFSFFPSGLVAYNLSETRQVKASYSKRIQRPDSRLLNPFPYYEDPENVIIGNPSLRPEYTHAFELGFQQSSPRGSIQVTPYYRHTTDAVRRTRDVQTIGRDSVITVATFQNLATSNSWGTDVNGSLRMGKLTAFGGFNVFRIETDGSNVDTNLHTEAVSWMTRGNLSWKASAKTDFQGMFMYRAPQNVEQGRIESMSMINLAMRQKLNDKATLSLRLQDPFNSMRFKFVTSDERYLQQTERRFGNRALFLNFSYNFGRPPRIRQPKPDESQAEDPRTTPY
ncbi:MAG: TonB-dependent receptor [Gemmatimonadetes bacterium]|nr:TonB-dependent receptor [Gemmatimonadota bacterium]